MTHTAPCRTCSGTGVRALRRAEWMTLDVLDRAEWRSTSDIAARLDMHHTAALIRLRKLEALGFVTSRRPAIPTSSRGGVYAFEWRLDEGVNR